MASRTTEVELVKGGMSQTDVERPGWVQNLWKPRSLSAWQTRPGFGQRAQLDSTMLLSEGPDYGIKKHLGSELIQTSFGHEQIVSVFLTTVATADTIGLNNRFLSLYSVWIYDLATDQYWEEVLHRHSSQNIQSRSLMSNWTYNYQTNEDEDNQSWVSAIDSPFFFEYFSNVLYFGNERTGLWAYHPADFRNSRSKQIENSQKLDFAVGYGESNLVHPVTPVDGVFSDAYTYLDQSSFPRVKALGSVLGRLVISDGQSVFISDLNKGNQFIARNSFQIPSQNEITAISQIGDNILIYTETETFLYQPSPAPVLSVGRLQVVSKNIGCLGDGAVVSRGNNVLWADRNGVYVTANGLSIKTISEPIDSFFNGSITSPLHNYFTASGTTDMSITQPTTLYKFDPSQHTVKMVYHEETSSLLFSISELNLCWYFNGDWALWTTESMVSVSGGTARVGVTSNIFNPYVLAGEDDIFLVSSVETQEFTTIEGAVSTPTTSHSMQILQMGRGGALDRSVKDEDQRLFRRLYDFKTGTTSTGVRMYAHQLGYNAAGDLEVQFDLVPSANVERPDRIDLLFTFDNARWTPRVSSGAILDIEAPTERIIALDGFSLGGPIANQSEAQVYNTSGSADATGNEIRIRWNATASSLADLNMSRNNRNPFVIVKFIPAETTTSITGFGISSVTVTATDGSTAENGQLIVEQTLRTDQRRANDSVAQPVDWCYKGADVGLAEQPQIRSRGLYSQILSHGAGSTKVISNWTYGLYNVLMGSDWKEWTTQVIDTTGDLTQAVNKDTTRARAADSTSTLKHRTFNNNLKYGSYLVDDEEYNVNAVSMSVKGKSVSHMSFGFLMNRAEKIVIGSVKAALRAAGGRRRTGR